MILNHLTRLREWGALVRRKPLNIKQVEYPGKGFLRQVRIRIDTREVPKGLKVNVARTIAELRKSVGQTEKAGAPFLEWSEVGKYEHRLAIYFKPEDPAAEKLENVIPITQTPSLSIRGWLDEVRKLGIPIEQSYGGQTGNNTIKISIPTIELDDEKKAQLDRWMEKLHEHVRDQNEDEIPKQAISVEHKHTRVEHRVTFTVPNPVTAGSIRNFFNSGPTH